MPERDDLQKEALKTSEKVGKNSYVDSLVYVNGEILAPQKIPLSEGMDRTARENLEMVSEGIGSLPLYHLREAGTLTSDAVSAARDGDARAVAINTAGALANTFAFFGSGAMEHQEYKRGHYTSSADTSSADTSSADTSSNDATDSGCPVM